MANASDTEMSTHDRRGDRFDALLREQLEVRRDQLAAVPGLNGRADLLALLQQVDSALTRMDRGTYGACARCDGSVSEARLLHDPLLTVCLDCLTDNEARALERDLESASSVQSALLPREETLESGWEIRYRFLPRGPVSGDHCDVIPGVCPDGSLVVTLGDVSGKGVAASLVAANLHAVVRGLAARETEPANWLPRLNRLMCETTLPSFYVTLTAGLLSADGRVVLSNAGHNPPRVVRPGEVTMVPATGLPLGLFCDLSYGVEQFRLGPGDLLVLHTDGVTEATDRRGEPYGEDRLTESVGRLHGLSSAEALDQLLGDQERFRDGAPLEDDVTVLVARRTH